MKTTSSLLLAFFGLATMSLSSPAWATDGRTAVGMCIDSTASGARCAWSVNKDGSIDICNKNGCVYCPSATSECTVARKIPIRHLPKDQPVNGSQPDYANQAISK